MNIAKDFLVCLLLALPSVVIGQSINAAQLTPDQFTARPGSDDGVWQTSSGIIIADAEEAGGRATDSVDEWFISPAIDLSDLSGAKVSFFSKKERSDSAQADPMTVWVSNTYNSGALLNPANWTKLSATLPSGNADNRTYSGEIDVSAFATAPVYLALRYRSSGRTASTSTRWTIDNLRVYSDSVSEPKTLSLLLSRNTISESDGQNAATGTVMLSAPSEEATTVTLLGSEAGTVQIPQTISLGANESSVSFPIHTARDGVINGTRTVTLTASAEGYGSANATLTLLDSDEPLAMTLSTTVTSVDESTPIIPGGGKLSLNQPAPASGMQISLSTIPAGRLGVPAAVFIAGGQTEMSFDLQPVWNVEDTADATVTLTATASGVASVSTTIVVRNKTPIASLVFDRATISEHSTVLPVTGTLTLETRPQQNLAFELNYNDPSAVNGPSSVVIGAGQTVTTFTIFPVVDVTTEDDIDIQVTATSSKTTTATNAFTILNEPWTFEFTCQPGTVLETAGDAAISLAIVSSFPLSEDTLFSVVHTGRLTSPQQLALPKNRTTLVTTIGVVDHSANTGPQSVTLTLVGPGGKAFSRSVTIQDVPRHLELIATRNRVPELDRVTLGISRTQAEAKPLLVRLSAEPEDTFELPAYVIIPANSVGPIEIDVRAGYRTNKADWTGVIRAVATDYAPQTYVITITDNTPRMSLLFSWTELRENAGKQENFGNVLLTHALPVDTEVALNVENEEQLIIPERVVISAGQTSVSFPVEIYNDGRYRGDRALTVVGKSEGYPDMHTALKIIETDPLIRPEIKISVATDRHRVKLGNTLQITAALSASASPLRYFDLLINDEVVASGLGVTLVHEWTPTEVGSYRIASRVMNEENFGDEEIYGRILVVVDPNPINDNALFVRQLYKDLFNREPSADALRQATDKLNGGTMRGVLAKQFFEDADIESLKQLHRAAMLLIGRPLRWEELYEGTSLTGFVELQKHEGFSKVADALIRSADFTKAYGLADNMSDREFFALVYQLKHGQMPSPQQITQGITRISSMDPSLGFGGDRGKFLEVFILDKKINNAELIYGAPAVDTHEQVEQALVMAAFWRMLPDVVSEDIRPGVLTSEELDRMLWHPYFRERFGVHVLDAHPLGGGWTWTYGLGYLYDHYWPWLYSPTVGWLWPANDNPEALYLWNPVHEWLFSSDLWGQYAYRFRDGRLVDFAPMPNFK